MPSSRRNVTAKLTPTTPPESRTASSCASVRFRVDAQRACAFECVATIGRLDVSTTSQNPRSFRCETSTRMPSSLHVRTSARPASVRPGPVSGDAGNWNGTPSANAFGRDQTMPTERRPRSYQSCRFDRSSAIASAPSMCTIAVTSPSRKSSTDRARADRHRTQRVEQLLGDPCGLVERNRGGKRHGSTASPAGRRHRAKGRTARRTRRRTQTRPRFRGRCACRARRASASARDRCDRRSPCVPHRTGGSLRLSDL